MTVRRCGAEPGRLPGHGGAPIVGLAGDDAANPSGRIGYVAHVPWNDVYVQMEHGLASGASDVDADVETVRRVRSWQ